MEKISYLLLIAVLWHIVSLAYRMEQLRPRKTTTKKKKHHTSTILLPTKGISTYKRSIITSTTNYRFSRVDTAC